MRIGALGVYKFEYEGSDEYKARGLPLIDVTWRDVFLSFNKGPNYKASHFSLD